MPRAFRFSLQAMNFGDASELAAVAREAEELGYEELFTADHVGAPDPIIPLIAAASATTRLRFGPLVLNNELHHPALLARAIATADQMTRGRMILGVGTGYSQVEHNATGIVLRSPPDRVRRLEESLIVLRALLNEGSVSFEGSHHTVELDDLGIRPMQGHVPFLIGGHGRRVVGIAARHADIFQFTGLTHGADGAISAGGFDISIIRERSRWLADEAGDRLSDIERSVLVQGVEIGDQSDVQIQAAASRLGVDRSLIEQTPFLLMGSVEQVVDKIERLREDLGITHYVVRDAAAFAPVVARLR